MASAGTIHELAPEGIRDYAFADPELALGEGARLTQRAVGGFWHGGPRVEKAVRDRLSRIKATTTSMGCPAGMSWYREPSSGESLEPL